MVIMVVYSVEYHGFNSQSGQTKNYKIGILLLLCSWFGVGIMCLNASSLKQHSVGRHVDPLWHIILFLSQLYKRLPSHKEGISTWGLNGHLCWLTSGYHHHQTFVWHTINSFMEFNNHELIVFIADHILDLGQYFLYLSNSFWHFSKRFIVCVKS